VQRSIIVGKPATDVYGFWRDFRNLPRVFPFLSAVTVTDARRSHWRLVGPGGLTAEWDAIIERDEPGRLIEWHSVEPAALPNRGTVEFRPAAGAASTEVVLNFEFEAPAAHAQREVAGLLGADLDEPVAAGLRRFKEFLEIPVVPR
jgi:uncharacterized membrane protein